jgi:uncharacterized protein (TIGR00730 family)
MMIEPLCVFCGASSGSRPEYKLVAEELGALLASRKIRLIYGGGNVGLMGAIADACLAAGGAVTGVIPQALMDKEIAHRGLTELHVVKSMHERKAMMAELAGAFVALPGGFGTFEEFFEVLTWTQLGLQQKACGLVNVLGYYDSLLSLADKAVEEGFLPAAHRKLVLAADSAAELLALLVNFKPSVVPKWIGRGKGAIDDVS